MDDLSFSMDIMPTKAHTKRRVTALSRRLQRVMDETGWNQAELARAAKASPQNVSSWMSGQNDRIRKTIYAFNIQAASGFSAAWIMEGAQPVYIKLLTPADAKLLEALRNAPAERKTALKLILPGLDI